MVLPATTWNHGYTFVASLTSALVCLLAVMGGAMMLFDLRVFADFDTDLPTDLMFFSRLGVAGIASVLLGFLAIVGLMFLCERQRLAVMVVLIAAGMACLYFGVMLLASIGIWLRITFSVM